MSRKIKIEIELRNLMKIDHHIKIMKDIESNINLSSVEEIIMMDTISILEGIKKEASK